MELTKQDVCALQCAVLEAIGLNTDQIHASTDPGERRALEANIAVYRRALQKLRAIEADAISTDCGNARCSHQTISELMRYSKRAMYQGETVFVADTAKQEREWRSKCELGQATEVSRSMFRVLCAEK